MKDRKLKGTLVLEEVKFDRMLKRKVHRSNKTSGKVTLPPDLVGKEVIIIIPSKRLNK